MERGVVIWESGVHRLKTFRQPSCRVEVSSWNIACRFGERCQHAFEQSVAHQLPKEGSCWKGIRRRSRQNWRSATAAVTEETTNLRHRKHERRDAVRFGRQSSDFRSFVASSRTFAGLGYQRGNAASVTDFHGSAAWRDLGVTSTPPTLCLCNGRRCCGIGFPGPGNQEYNAASKRFSVRIEQAL